MNLIASDIDRRSRLLLFVTGALAALAMVATMLLLREVTETQSLIEIIGEAIVQAIPMDLFSALLELFGSASKQLLVIAIVAGILLVGGGLAQVDGGAARELPPVRRTRRIVGLTFSTWIPLAIIALIITTYGTVNPATNAELVALAAIVFIDLFVYAVVLYLLYPLLDRALESTRVDSVDRPPADLSRRRAIALGAAGLIGLAGIGTTARFLRNIRGGAIGGGTGGLSEPITPTRRFYVISKNFVDPDVDADDWQLEINGMVERAQTFSYPDLLALDASDQLTTLMCISYEIGGDLISNARWTGVPLVSLLDQAGVRQNATELVLYADDGYTESLPLAKALEPTTMLVWLMNGEPLTRKHGYPARLIVPGNYGIKNVKWLTRIELSSGDFKGYWQQRGWTDEATIETMSRFDIPNSRAILPQEPVELGGIAFAGDRGIQAVEISVNDGEWQPVDTIEQIAPLSWALWRSTWNPPGSGTFTLRVRAIDGTGAVQTDERRDPIPDGATGYHSIELGIG